MSQSEDIDAVNQFMKEQRVNIKDYPSLTKTLDSWDTWYAGLGWYDKTFNSSSWIRAKQYREEVENIYKTYIPIQPGQPTVPKPPILPTVPVNTTQMIKIVAYGTGAIIGGLIILKAIKLMPENSR
jgi:hypothetical protein